MDDRISALKEKLQRIMETEPIGLGEKLEDLIPAVPGVYRLFRRDSGRDESIYFGKSLNLRRRLLKDHVFGNQRRSSVRDELIERGSCRSEEEVTEFLTGECAVQFVEMDDAQEREQLVHFAVAVLEPIVRA
jgi:hypothetical protein